MLTADDKRTLIKQAKRNFKEDIMKRYPLHANLGFSAEQIWKNNLTVNSKFN